MGQRAHVSSIITDFISFIKHNGHFDFDRDMQQ